MLGNRYKTSFFILFLFVASSAQAAGYVPLVAPVYSVGACPFEGCQYTTWIAEERIPIHREMDEASDMVFYVDAGESVTGLTGVVVTTKLGQLKVLTSTVIDRSHEGKDNIALNAGDTVFTIHYLGEGYRRMWYKGKFFDDDMNIETDDNTVFNGEYLQDQETIWWVQVKNANGQTGWTTSTKFKYLDSLGSE